MSTEEKELEHQFLPLQSSFQMQSCHLGPFRGSIALFRLQVVDSRSDASLLGCVSGPHQWLSIKAIKRAKMRRGVQNLQLASDTERKLHVKACNGTILSCGSLKIHLQHAQFTLQDPGIEAPRPTLGSMSSSSILLTNTRSAEPMCVQSLRFYGIIQRRTLCRLMRFKVWLSHSLKTKCKKKSGFGGVEILVVLNLPITLPNNSIAPLLGYERWSSVPA